MQMSYNDKTNLLYIRLDSETQDVINRDVADGITVDIGAGDRIVGIEILDASRRLDLRQCSVEPRHGRTEDKEGTMELTISVQMWKKDNWYIAKCPELDFVSEGGDPAEARRNLLEVVEIQLEEMTELGTLDEYLSECGYVPHIEMVGFEKQSVAEGRAAVGTVVWPNEQDICPGTLYPDSQARPT